MSSIYIQTYAINEPVPTWPDVGTAPVNTFGPCSYNKHPDAYSNFEYNSPDAGEHKSWGYDAVGEYTEGDVIDVAWCVDNNGDHGGMYSYRLCHDEAIVKNFITPGYVPTDAEKIDAEEVSSLLSYLLLFSLLYFLLSIIPSLLSIIPSLLSIIIPSLLSYLLLSSLTF